MNFPKSERLTAKRDIDALFAQGKSAREQFLAVKYLDRERTDDEPPFQILFSVPKRNLKRAVQRNRVKRMLRELYRCNKPKWQKLPMAPNKKRLIAVIYTGKSVPAFLALSEVSTRLADKIKPQNPED